MANNSIARNISGLFPEVVSLLIFLDGTSALFIGALYFFHIHMTDYFSDNQTIGVMARQQANFVVWLTFGYLVSCVIAIIYVQKRRRFGAIVLACLAAFHTIGIALLRIVNSHFLMIDFLKPVMYVSFLINLLLLFLIFRSNISTGVKTG